MAEIGTDIAYAASLLREGKLVGIPTDTVYGVAGNAFDESAIRKIYKAKNRPMNLPLIAQVDSIEKAEILTSDFPEKGKTLVEKYWPGPLTLVVKKSEMIPSVMVNGGATVGIRIPNHSLTLDLLSMLDFPLAVPSANIHGQPSAVTANEVNDQIGDEIDYILDGGKCAISFESTLVGFDGEDLVILRSGAISQKELESSLKKS